MRRIFLFLTPAALALLLALAEWLAARAEDCVPRLRAIDYFVARFADWLKLPAMQPPRVTVTFFGVSTLLFTDGQTSFMIDGFFTRPSNLNSIEPDRSLIASTLSNAGIANLAAVAVNHSHFDHAMDAPIVAELTGAVLVGSQSTKYIAEGLRGAPFNLNLPDDRIRLVPDRTGYCFGRFRVTFVPSAHLDTDRDDGGNLGAPLVPPQPAEAYKDGGTYSIVIKHWGRRALVQSSANFVPGALDNYPVRAVYLGVGGLQLRDAAYRDNYWNAVVAATGAQRVYPIHWDDFQRPLTEPLVPMAGFDQDVPLIGYVSIMTYLNSKNVPIELPTAAGPTFPFE